MYIEEDEQWRDGLNDFLSGHKDINWISYNPAAGEVASMLDQYHIHVIVNDTMQHTIDRSALYNMLDAHHIDTNIKYIMFTSLDQADDIFNEAFLHEANEYVKMSDFDQLPHIIRQAATCRSYTFGDQLHTLVHGRKKLLVQEGYGPLLHLIVKGKSQPQIARELSMSTAAIAKKINQIHQMFNWKGSIQQLADKCAKWGIL
ncbi:hypothetical protein M3180_08730 [Paenibacillus camelliae]|nr:hypothetical protein [Paenibacillus camelliae]